MRGKDFRVDRYGMTDVRRDDAQLADFREAGDEGLGHAVGEVTLSRIAREIGQRQHGERTNLRRAGLHSRPNEGAP